MFKWLWVHIPGSDTRRIIFCKSWSVAWNDSKNVKSPSIKKLKWTKAIMGKPQSQLKAMFRQSFEILFKFWPLHLCTYFQSIENLFYVYVPIEWEFCTMFQWSTGIEVGNNTSVPVRLRWLSGGLLCFRKCRKDISVHSLVPTIIYCSISCENCFILFATRNEMWDQRLEPLSSSSSQLLMLDLSTSRLLLLQLLLIQLSQLLLLQLS